MGVTYFPTRNENGVRNLAKSTTLGDYLYQDYRAPAEPRAKAAMNPVNLGAIAPAPAPTFMWARVSPVQQFVAPAPPVNAAPPVSMQSTPTPQFTVPAAPSPTVIYVTSGGGTASPAPAAAASDVTQSPTTSTVTVAPAAASVTDQVASWLGGTTAIGSYAIPNALLAGGFAVVVAMLMSSGGKKR